MTSSILFWHRNDLRLSDNIGLAAARQLSPKVIGAFCLDPHILEGDDVAPARVAYMIGCLEQLQQSYRQAGSELLILHDMPELALPKLAAALQAKAVFWNRDVEPYARERDRRVRQQLEQQGLEVQTFWDKLLHPPGEVMAKASGQPYTVYTPFWKNWSQQAKAEPVATLVQAEGLTEEERECAREAGVKALPSAEDLGYNWENGFMLPPGETAARERLEEFCTRALYEYREERNFPGLEGTSQLSAALKFGAIGLRTVWKSAAEIYANARSEESQANIQTWQKELAWREFYQHAMYFFPELENGPYRPLFQNFPWDNNERHFQAWCDGKTGYPIVDAAMRQLNETGWMHNRCRMIVASFLTKDLIINWQWGEKYFLQKLYDGDLSANNGGWQWSASSGMDPQPLRIFNPSSQAQKFDPEGDYIRQWVPELSSLDAEYLVTGKIPPSERSGCGYPAPIVDHNKQQREFKRRYSEQKAAHEA